MQLPQKKIEPENDFSQKFVQGVIAQNQRSDAILQQKYGKPPLFKQPPVSECLLVD